MRYRLRIEYDGTNYSGWQKQGHGLSIQEILEECLFKLSGEKNEVVGSGRTDAGVHALAQVAHFDLNGKQFPETTIVQALNYYLCEFSRVRAKRIKNLIIGELGNFYRKYAPLLKQDIIVKDCKLVENDFHARFSSKMRYYRYLLLNTKQPSILWSNRAWHVKEPLDLAPMQIACSMLVGQHDFSSFRDSQCQALSPVKTINSCEIHRNGDIISLEIAAKSFLHHMVRNIVGTLKDVGSHRTDPDRFKSILESQNRKKAGVNAPAHGLYFVRVDY
ncbi:MAG: tRNA pseudouridine(38-40) synthase TruA [Rickettsiales bacterium]|jgi:tRNA pseudouridine38-40 synthase|nr:tRNA pseudouridine(38-40) synthase TruA [Rickettsiales bacterium]